MPEICGCPSASGKSSLNPTTRIMNREKEDAEARKKAERVKKEYDRLKRKIVAERKANSDPNGPSGDESKEKAKEESSPSQRKKAISLFFNPKELQQKQKAKKDQYV